MKILLSTAPWKPDLYVVSEHTFLQDDSSKMFKMNLSDQPDMISCGSYRQNYCQKQLFQSWHQGNPFKGCSEEGTIPSIWINKALSNFSLVLISFKLLPNQNLNSCN